MKKKHLVLSVLLGTLSFGAFSQTGSVKLRGTRLTYPLVRKWISEFQKAYPLVKVEIAPNAPADSLDLEIYTFDIAKSGLKEGKEAAVLNRYAQLPIANSKRPDLKELQAKGFTEADFKKIYFTEETGKAPVGSHPIVVYKREKPACAARSFATHYGSNPNQTPGIGVKGDDRDLSISVKKDINGLSYNNLGFVYDIATRKVADSLAVIPLDLNENGRIDADERIYGTLDQVIAYIEKTNNAKIPFDNVNVVFDKQPKNAAAGLFLQWVLTEGQKFNHEFGFVDQEKAILSRQKEIVSGAFKN